MKPSVIGRCSQNEMAGQHPSPADQPQQCWPAELVLDILTGQIQSE
jgi:hypothetical protein